MIKKELKSTNKYSFFIVIAFCLLIFVVHLFVEVGRPDNISDDAISVGTYDSYWIEKISSSPKEHIVRIKVYTNTGEKLAIDADFYTENREVNFDSIAEFAPAYGKSCAIILKSGKYLTPIKRYGGYLDIGN